MNLRKLNEELDKVLNGNFVLSKQNLNELAWKNACGIELTKEIAKQLQATYPNLPELKTNNNDAKISWLIKYLDIVPKEELIGLKISKIGTIEYTEENISKQEDIALCIGDTDLNNKIKSDTNQGLYHMKYGINHHWSWSKSALHVIPKDFIHSTLIKIHQTSKYKYIYKVKKERASLCYRYSK